MKKIMNYSFLLAVLVLFLSVFLWQKSSIAWQITPPPSAAGYGSPHPMIEPQKNPDPVGASGGYGAPPPAITDEAKQQAPAAGGYGAPPPTMTDKDKQQAPPAASGLNISKPPAAGGYGNIYGN